jgi:branched-chain amino acid transport system substrate-binding protein
MNASTLYIIAAPLLQLACSSNEPRVTDFVEAEPSDANGPSSTTPQPAPADPLCSTNRECIDRGGGLPSRCDKSTGECASLLSPDCPRYLGSESDMASDDAIAIGLLVVDDANGAEGEAAVEMARSEIALALGGGVRTSSSSPVRPLVVIVCDTDGDDPREAARHLVRDVNVSALLGGFISSNVLSIAEEYTIPGGVLQIAPSATADPISALDDQDLVYRAQIPGDILFQVLTPFIDEVIEPAIHAEGIAAPDEPIRVMLVYEPDGSGVYQAATIAKYLRIDGEPVSRDGSASYRELRLDPPNPLDPQPLSVVAARAISDYRPHFIIYQTQNESLLEAVESGWPPGVSKPYFIVSAGFGARLPDFVGADAALRKRAYSFLGLPRGFDEASFDQWSAALRSSSSALTRPISRIYGPNLYDSLYMLTYAISTLGDLAPTGLNLVPGFRRLGASETPIRFGPSEMQSALDALAAGRSIDYVGVSGVFRYTAEGDRTGLAAIGCVTIDEAGNATGTKASGFVYDAEVQRIESTVISCP